ncbi:GNAT family N-acetyltransferase [Streptomyces sp. NBC_01465]|uniref:GNAT family N-acetyltransferase n=1 Tax=Streptomyces sp. NBC_01465 TaxID=2903878 RepID=UPI002E300EF7|nr:GNAT family N-acetyltransferase [Streptomyces sp. NBC_01465]
MEQTAHPTIRTISDPAEASRILNDLAPVYEEVYADPPYNEGPRDVAEWLDLYAKQIHIDGFRLATAHIADELVGFSYGFPLPSTSGWWRNFLPPAPDLGEEFTAENGRRTFSIREFAVLVSHRRHGIARGLHAALLHGNPAERFTLTARPEAPAALALYESLGYQRLGLVRPWDTAPVYECMVLPLR